jgi:RimJ/RimL family protein N-acetyltransferase
MRSLKILISLFKGLSLRDFFTAARPALFRNDEIFIFASAVKQISMLEGGNPREVNIVKGNISDLDQMQNRLNPVPWEFRCHKYDGVRDFFIACNTDGIQSIAWIYYQNDHNRFLRLATGDALLHYCLTLPPFRGQGLYPKVLKAATHFLGDQGFKRVFVLAEKNNHASIRGIEKAGFRRIGRIHLRKMMGVQLSRRFDTGRLKS